MKPLRLSLENFGPYRQETLDFAALEAAPLFLISGKTGSGKTTLFDGICYALYGQTSGGLRSAREMRSNFADPSMRTTVTLYFEHQQKKYSIMRSPEQVVTKKRGEGLRTQTAKVELIAYDREDQPEKQWSKQKEVQEKIEELLHLNAAQFCQIVLLPQGDFMRFLQANSDEKEKVLRQLFGTEYYLRIAERIKEKRKAYQKDLEESETATEHIYRQVEWAEDLAETATSTTALAERVVLVEQQVGQYQEQEAQTASERLAVEQKTQAVQQRLYQEEQLTALFKEQEVLAQARVAHEEQREQWRERRQRLETLEKIDQLVPQKKALMEAEMRVQQAEQELLEAQESASKSHSEVADAQETVQKVKLQAVQVANDRQLMEQVRADIARTEQIAHLENQLQTAKQLTAKDEKRLADIQQQQSQINEQIKSEAEWQQLFEANRLAQNQAEADLKQSAQQVDWLTQLLAGKAALEHQQQKLQQQTEWTKETQEQAAEAGGQLKRYRHQWAQQEIARLQQDLLPGEPCPVCGSREHPLHQTQDISSEQSFIRQETVEMAEQEVQKWQQKVAEATSQQQALAAEATRLDTSFKELAALYLESQTAKVAAALDWEVEYRQVETAHAQLKDQLATLTAKQQQLDTAYAAEADKKATYAQLESERLTLQTQLQKSLPEQMQLEAELAQLQPKRLTQPKAEMVKQVAQLEKTITAFEQTSEQAQRRLQEAQTAKAVAKASAEQAQQRLVNSKTQFNRKQQQFEEALATAELTEAVYNEWAPQIDQLLAEKKAYQEFVIEERAQEQAWLRLQTKIGDQQLPDAAATKLQLTASQKELADVTLRYHESLGRTKRTQKNAETLRKAFDRLQKQWEELAEYQQLSNVLNGEGQDYKISIERFVLQLYLGEVLRVANYYLARFTQSRYQFEREAGTGRYRTQSGLELNIYDDNTGGIRSVRTLSGGESFIAALSLALALAEVVQQQAGGVEVAALFIDEGFGSLDEESLEVAMQALEGLQNQERMIGLISHVPALKERIPAQIQIQQDRFGASQFVVQSEWKEK